MITIYLVVILTAKKAYIQGKRLQHGGVLKPREQFVRPEQQV